MRRTAPAALTALAVLAVAACSPGGPSSTPSGIPYSLSTHCGITELAYDGFRYAREGGPLSDGRGNPPAGWGNPSQDGWLLLGDDSVTFQDASGHSEEFTLRPTTHPPRPACS